MVHISVSAASFLVLNQEEEKGFVSDIHMLKVEMIVTGHM